MLSDGERLLLVLGSLLLVDLSGFGLAFLGHIGSLHHAVHVLIAMAGIEGILIAAFGLIYGLFE